MDIGKEKETIQVEPAEDPFRKPNEAPVETPVETPEKVEVPA